MCKNLGLTLPLIRLLWSMCNRKVPGQEANGDELVRGQKSEKRGSVSLRLECHINWRECPRWLLRYICGLGTTHLHWYEKQVVPKRVLSMVAKIGMGRDFANKWAWNRRRGCKTDCVLSINGGKSTISLLKHNEDWYTEFHSFPWLATRKD